MSKREQQRRDKTLLRYYLAAGTGDMDTVCGILLEADPILRRQIFEMEEVLAEGQRSEAMLAWDRALVRDLLHHHLSTEPDAPPTPLSLGQVISRMQADAQVADADRDAVQSLLSNPSRLPARLSGRAVRDFFVQQGARTSERFQRLFRDTAIVLGLAASQEQAAYARRQAQQAPRDDAKDQGDPHKDGPHDRKGKDLP